MILPDPTSLQLQPFHNFHAATSAVVKFLQGHLGFDLCMVTRVKDGKWIVLNVEDRRYGMKAGAIFPWRDTLCYANVIQQGHGIVPDINAVPAYTSAPLAQQFNIGAYISLPLFHGDGTLFGTLCAWHPEAKPTSMEAQQPLLRLMVQLLVSLLDSDLKLLRQKRQVERSQAETWRDPLTGLYNKQAWLHFLGIEDSRCHRYGRDAGVVNLELDINGDLGESGLEWFKAVADLLRAVLREEDIMARVSANEIAVIAVEADIERLKRLLERIQTELRPTAFSVAYGCAVRDPSGSLAEAWHHAQTDLRRGKYANMRSDVRSA